MDVAEIAALMLVPPGGEQVQLTQTGFRRRVVDTWRIEAGERVLELGCGQGDLTAVLADAVGPGGHVTAIDPAPATYGAPTTLGQSTGHLAASPLGPRMDIRLETDVLDPAVAFADGEFDVVVLAHSSWYFPSVGVLTETLRRVRPWARRLCFAEWDLTPRSLDQVPHLLAVLIQGQIELHKAHSESNVRTPFSRARAIAVLADAGWTVTGQDDVDTTGQQDARWEIAQSIDAATREAHAVGGPERLPDFVAGQVDTLRELLDVVTVAPLPTYSLRADPIQPGCG